MRRSVQLLIGLFLFGVGLAFVVRATLGAAPWDVLTLGISSRVSLTFGTISVIVSFVVLLIWIPLRQKPGVGTIANALLVGPSADIGLFLIPETETLWVRVAFMLGGITLVGFATGLYIGSRFGPGPRDGLMTGLHRVTGRPIWVVRTLIEATVLVLGWLLGGTVGVGTVAFVLLIGPICQYFMRIFYVTLPSDAVVEDVAPIPPDLERDMFHVENPAT
ncbi:MAG: hypothetical protein M9947_03105 [Thermomicrobiales bacterium]|nr:hypothetical protein [Thermomicrobiales bacterium]